MTKLRQPLSFEAALMNVIGAIGREEALAITGRTHSRLVDYLDPDKDGSIRLDHAFLLERRYRELGHPGAPLHDAWREQLGLGEGHGIADSAALLRQASIVAKETGDATAAAIAAASPNATDADKAIARREIDEAIAELAKGRTMLEPSAQPP